MHGWLIALDLFLLLGATMRLTRFIVTDDLGLWWIRHPADKWADQHKRYVMHSGDVTTYSLGWRGKLVSGLVCPWCVGFWVGVGVLATLALVGGPGEASTLWRYVVGAFTLNEAAAHLGIRLGDTNEDDDE